ncbi:hypothetical protein [Lysobacter sp. F6437]|uniref:hypothetical protein n=1 Tax=Lysobacter sp. F6437 TaxID=3459296 RepID=UPI00403D7D03
MNIRTIAILPVLLVVGAGCDRRDAEPIEPSETTTTVVDDSAATTPTSTIPSATESCTGLTGEAATDCRMRTGDDAPSTMPPADAERENGGAPPSG